MTEKEEWKKIKLGPYEYNYYISTLGRVKNKKGQILKPWKRGKNNGVYHCVGLYHWSGRKKIDIQRLVALHFIPNPEYKPEVNHMNLDHFDNRVSNLEWSTHSENVQHRYFMEAHLDLVEEAV